MITLLRELRWIVQGCHCWQTREKLVVVFNNLTLIMTIFGPTSYLRKHRANRCVLWHFRVFPDLLWCTSATKQNWQNSVKYMLTFFFFTKNMARKLQWDLTKLYSKFICLMKDWYLKWRGLAEVRFLSQGDKKMFFKCTLSIQVEFTFYRLRIKPLKIMWTSCMQSRLIRVALSVLSTFSCILFDKDFKLQNAIKNELRKERLLILVRIILVIFR